MNTRLTLKFVLLALLSIVALGKKRAPKKPTLSTGEEVEAHVVKLIHDNDVSKRYNQ